jgi:hypothetical protein
VLGIFHGRVVGGSGLPSSFGVSGSSPCFDYQIIHFSGSTTLIQTQPHQMHLSFSIFDAIPLRCCERSLPVLDPLRGSLQLWLSTLPDLEECWIGMDSLEHQG